MTQTWNLIALHVFETKRTIYAGCKLIYIENNLLIAMQNTVILQLLMVMPCCEIGSRGDCATRFKALKLEQLSRFMEEFQSSWCKPRVPIVLTIQAMTIQASKKCHAVRVPHVLKVTMSIIYSNRNHMYMSSIKSCKTLNPRNPIYSMRIFQLKLETFEFWYQA